MAQHAEPLEELVERIDALTGDRSRVFIAIAGPPGAGKSTLADKLARRLPRSAILPMDGFHLDNAVLNARGLLHRKGSPDTFDTEGLAQTLQAVKAGGAIDVPTFDRDADRVVPAGGKIGATVRIVLVEGNYLLLDAPGWRDLRTFWDMTVAINVPRAELQRRLLQRWHVHGFSEADARAKVEQNDLLNADSVLSQSFPADVTILDTGS